jgi:putative ABC transport system ATP-binding protein
VIDIVTTPLITKTAIAAHHMGKTYGKGESEFVALKDISFNVQSGERIAIIGKSGSGKSTLMHLMALMDTPSSGTVMIGDQNVASISKRKLDLMRNQTFGFVFQQFFLNGNASVLDNVVLPLKIAGVGASERRKRGLAALADVELSEKARNKANDLSGGQKQRVVIARALINNPQIIFADEPTGNLDTVTGAKIEQLLFDLNRQHGITLIIVTHDADLAAKCDRQIHIADGQMVRELIR